MQVLAWPYNGRPGKVNVMRSSPNPATWIRAQVTFRKVDNFFIVLRVFYIFPYQFLKQANDPVDKRTVFTRVIIK